MCSHNGLLSDCNDCERSISVLAGPAGLNGTNGNSVANGTGAPSSTLPATQTIYIDRNSPFNVYFRINNVWTLYGQLKGTDGNGFLVQQTVSISQAEISTLSSVGKVLLAAIPASYFINLITAVGINKPGGIPYSVSVSQTQIRYTTTGDVAAYWTSSLLGSSLLRIEKAYLGSSATPVIPAGSGLTLKQTILNPTSGDGTLDIQFVYQIQSV